MKKLLTLGALLALAAPVGACGEKPKPTPRGATAPSPATDPAGDRGPSGPGAEPDRTPGGVALAGAPRRVAQVALALSRRQDSATRQLIAAGDEARPMARALLASLNLAEIEGALAYFGAHPDADALTDIARLVGHDSAAVRQAARHALKGQRGPQLAQALAPLTEDPRPDVRVGAVRTLADVGGLLARTALLARLADAQDAVVLEAGGALSRLGPPADQATLDKIFADPEARPAQLRAAFTIARRASGRVPAAAAQAAVAGADEALATAAARAFACTPHEDAAAALKAVWDDARPAVRRALVEGLVEVGGDAHRADLERLADLALAADDQPLRIAGATALAHLIPAAARAAAKTTAVPTPAPAPKPEGEAAPAPKPEGEAAPAPKPEGEAAPTPKPEGEAAPTPKPEGEAAPTPKLDVHFAADPFGPIPDRLLGLLADPQPAMRRAAAALLSEQLPGPITAFRLDAQVDAEADATTRQVLLSALARIRTRDAYERVIARLDSEALGKLAHQALILAAATEIPRDAALWRAWLDARFGKPGVAATTPGDPADATTADPTGTTATTGDEGATPKAGEVQPLPDGTIPAHFDENGRWIPHKPPPLPPGYKKPDTPRPQVTGAPG